MQPIPQRLTRNLYAWEIAEAQTVFGSSLAYQRVRVREGIRWPDAINVIGRRLKGLPAPGPTEHNAVTLFFGSNFPINLPIDLPPLHHPEEYCIDWLIHELTHCWQYQHTGAIYIVRALTAQFTMKDAYDFGGPDNLNKVRSEGGTIFSFNPEAQANIAQSYYFRKRHNQDISAFEPFIDEIRKAQ